MKNILLFGGSNETGKFISKYINSFIKNYKIYNFSRNKDNYLYVDLNLFNLPIEIPLNQELIIISLAPIWLFVPYLENILKEKKINNKKILGIIVVSSTSAITKKYSWNNFDKILSDKLNFWEKKLFGFKDKHNINIDLIRPTLIYGDIGKNEDKNISLLLKIMLRTFILPIPKETGLRQPIHYSQLALTILKITKRILDRDLSEKSFINILNIGGDEELTFKDMIIRIKKSYPSFKKFNTCIIIEIPNRLFFVLALPTLIFSPKLYEAIQRIAINMNGFTKSYKVTGKKRKIFPISSKYLTP